MPSSKVAVFISSAVDRSPKRQQEIASEAGLGRQNIISMMKTGVTKVPFARIPKLAKALDVDPKRLFQLCVEEYMPELTKVIEEVYENSMLLSSNEVAIIKKLRALSKHGDPALCARNEDWLKSFVRDAA